MYLYEWPQFRISSTDSKVGTAMYCLIKTAQKEVVVKWMVTDALRNTLNDSSLSLGMEGLNSHPQIGGYCFCFIF